MSDLADLVKRVIKTNKMEDKIHIYKGKVETVELPEMVDVIVSEWMGSFAIFESMIESVLVARDRFLKQGGMIYPSDFSILFAPISIEELWKEKVLYWSSVYGIDMSDFM